MLGGLVRVAEKNLSLDGVQIESHHRYVLTLKMKEARQSREEKPGLPFAIQTGIQAAFKRTV